jgi:asparagine synthase (glutamine-hydrolysing)
MISLKSESKESYMFHYPNVDLVKLQSEAMNLPLIFKKTKGEKEKELEDLKAALLEAKEKYGVEGVVSGALFSKYQKERVDKVCEELGLKSIAPLWGIDKEELWKELFERNFRVMIVGIAAYGLNENWLGKEVNETVLEDLKKLGDKYKICIGFEGGEMESFVLDCSLFKKKIKVLEAEKVMTGEFSGFYTVKKAVLADK